MINLSGDYNTVFQEVSVIAKDHNEALLQAQDLDASQLEIATFCMLFKKCLGFSAGKLHNV